MENLEKVCWLEVELQHPKGWSMTAEGGGITSGYLKIDSRTRTKIELKWDKLSAKGEAKPGLQPPVLVNRLIDEQEKKLKKRKLKVEVLEKSSMEVCGHKAYSVRWRGEVETLSFSWVCREEVKIFLVNYYLEPSEKIEDVKTWFIPSITCHTQEPYWRCRLFGVEFKIPKEYKLHYRKLAIGKPLMVFKNSATLVIYWSYFAREILSNYGSLFQWSKKEIPGELEKAIRGLNRDKFKLEEKRLSLDEKVHTGLGRGSLFKKVVIWYDSNLNKIFVLGYLGPREDLELLENLEKSIVFKPD
ncbi:MAG: hypothetical protein QXQ66_06865 [Candidatus Hadarchaeum sp.]|uniref:hypothetical protein n=1 Tax=Candidatus Hadarchaeum sp. TaxID=2883567 RepID=UPI003174F679